MKDEFLYNDLTNAQRREQSQARAIPIRAILEKSNHPYLKKVFTANDLMEQEICIAIVLLTSENVDYILEKLDAKSPNDLGKVSIGFGRDRRTYFPNTEGYDDAIYRFHWTHFYLKVIKKDEDPFAFERKVKQMCGDASLFLGDLILQLREAYREEYQKAV